MMTDFVRQQQERDAILLAADVLARAALGDDWSLEAHTVLKRALLGIVDGVRR